MPTPRRFCTSRKASTTARNRTSVRPPAASDRRSAQSPMVAKKASMKGVCSVVSKRTSTPAVAWRARSAREAATPPATGSGMLKVRSGASRATSSRPASSTSDAATKVW